MTKIAVFSAGSWGTAFSLVLADAGNEVVLWGRREEVVEAINSRRENTDYLPGIELPPSVTASSDPEQVAAGADVVVLTVPSQSLRQNLTDWAPILPPHATLVSLMKGVELGSLMRMSEVIQEVTDASADRIAVVSGPNLAREIARREPAASVVACAEEETAKRLQALTHGPPSAPTPPSTSSAARSVVPTRTSSVWPSAWPLAWASGTTRPRPSSPVASPRPLVWRCRRAPTR